MWTVTAGALVFVPRDAHKRLALGAGGLVLDTVQYINRESK
jgi:hypothetical protein